MESLEFYDGHWFYKKNQGLGAFYINEKAVFVLYSALSVFTSDWSTIIQ